MNMKSLISTKKRKILLATIIIMATCMPMLVNATSIYTYLSNIVGIHRPQYTIKLSVTDPLPYGTVNLVAAVTPIPIYPPGAPVKFYASTDDKGASDGTKTWTLLTPVSQWTDGSGSTSYVYNLTGLAIYDFKATVNGTVTISGVTKPSNIVYTSNFVRASFAQYDIALTVDLADDNVSMNFNATVTSLDTPPTSVNGLTVTFVTSIDGDVTWQFLGTSITDVTGFATLNVLLTGLPAGDFDAQAQVTASIIIGPTPP